MSHMWVQTTKILPNCDSLFNKNYDVETNTSHDISAHTKFSEDSELNATSKVAQTVNWMVVDKTRNMEHFGTSRNIE